jgi:hypothetical protein
MGEETVVKIHESYEPAELALCLWLWVIVDGLNFLRNWRNTEMVNVVSQEVE